jgi:hypothetical protein
MQRFHGGAAVSRRILAGFDFSVESTTRSAQQHTVSRHQATRYNADSRSNRLLGRASIVYARGLAPDGAVSAVAETFVSDYL